MNAQPPAELDAEICRLLAAVPDCLWSADVAGERWTYRYISPVIESITRRPPEYFLAGLACWREIIFPEDRERWQEANRQFCDGQSGSREYRILLPDGAAIWVRDRVRARKERTGLVRLDGILADITSERKNEDLLEESYTILKAIAEGTTDAIFVKNREGRYLMINPAGANFLGRSVAEVLGKDDMQLFSPDSALQIMANDRRVLTAGETITVEDVGTAAGVTRIYLSTKGPYRDAQGNIIGLIGISRDITERKRAEEALRNSEALYHSLVESLPLSIYRKDPAGRFTFANKRFWTSLGKMPGDIVGKTDFDFFPKGLAEKYRQDDRRIMKTREIHEDVEEHVRADGKRVHVHLLKTSVFDFKGEVVGTQGIFWDITTRKQTEETLKRTAAELARSYQRLQQLATDLEKVAASERQAHHKLKKAQSQLVQSEKLASLGQTVAGVAHEINNPLAFVINNMAVLQRDVGALQQILRLYQESDKQPERRAELLGEIHDCAERIDLAYTLGNLDGLVQRTRDGLKRIQQIVKDLRDFARLDESDLKEVDLNTGIRSTLNIVRGRAVKQNVELEADLGELPAVLCFPAKVNQVVLNLVANAIDACAEGGKVIVRSQATAEEVLIHVIDNGQGIDPAIRDKIFDPFFTTKPPGQGTGLGLSISYSIMEDHGGRIEVSSTTGQGAHFIVCLPLRPAGGLAEA
jgi:PAS domain S-box-containing protein